MKIKILILAILFLPLLSLQAKDYTITDFGAVAGQLSTIAIQKAVDECAAAGGGRVLVPAGTFISGTIFLKSNVNL